MLLAFSTVAFSAQDLEFDAKRNGVELYGPYIKYNFLKPPYSFSQHEFNKTDLRFEIRALDSPAKTEEPKAEDKGEADKNQTKKQESTTPQQTFLYAIWPKYFLRFGQLTLYDLKNKEIESFSFSPEDVQTESRFSVFRFPFEAIKHVAEYEKGIHFCIKDRIPGTFVQVCSDKIKLSENQFAPIRKSDQVKVLVNGKKVPTNAQINLGKNDKEIEIHIKFKSGLKIFIKDQVRHVDIENVSLNIREKRIGVAGKRESHHKEKLSLKQQVFKFLKEKNYYVEKLRPNVDWPQELIDVEMEFAPYQEGAGTQLYGLSFDEIPSENYNIHLDDKAPIATYSSEVVLRGFKSPEEEVFGVRKGALKINKEKKIFLWKFKTPNKGEYNKDHIVYRRNKDQKFYLSRRVFRGHQGSISANAALTGSLDLSIVPGYTLNADFWPETIYNRHPAFFQRWGLGIGKFQTLSSFSVQGTREKFSVDWTNIDIMGRFTRGVRPVQSTFGAALRYLVPTVDRTTRSTLSPQMLGLGVFWHTAPQKIIDDFFNIAPFFRYPKWMEISLYVYPVTFADVSLGLAFSYHARGRLLFAQNWFFDASINVNSVTFQKAGDSKVSISTAHGTLGFGYSF